MNKTEFMYLGRSKKVEIKLRNQPVTLSNKIKYLGLVIDRNLNFKEHLEFLNLKVDTLVTKINRLSFFNCSIKWMLKKSSILMYLFP